MQRLVSLGRTAPFWEKHKKAAMIGIRHGPGTILG